MSLASEINEQLRILLDKPISPISYKQIVSLISKNVISNEVLISLFLSKYRGDLLIFLLQSSNLTILNIENILLNVKRDILKYNQTQVQMIWSFVLQRKEYSGLREEWGLFGLLTEGLRRTNEECKQKLLWLVSSNFEVLRQLGEGKMIESFVKAYCQKYLKQNIYLAPFPAIVSQSIQVSSHLSIEMIDPLTKVELLQRTLYLLGSTSNRHCYQFQNQCLNIIRVILEQKNLPFDSIHVHHCKKVVDDFLWKKATRQHARAAQQAILSLESKLIQQEKGKMEYVLDKDDKNAENESPLLIQNVIERVTQLRHRQQLLCSQIKATSPSQKSFLKKQSLTPGKRNSNKSKQMAALEDIIDNCFKQKEENLKQPLNQTAKANEKSFTGRDLETEKMIDSVYGPSEVGSSRAEQFDQFAEVSSLIDLAYQYKFS